MMSDEVSEAMRRIAGKWAELRALAPRHAMRPPMPTSDAALRALEEEFGVTLPADYAHYLTTIADGGPGPTSYPLYSLVETLLKHSQLDGEEALGRSTIVVSSDDDADHWTKGFARHDGVDLVAVGTDFVVGGDEPFCPDMAGTLTLGTDGCAFDYVLVVRGPTGGQVWATFDTGRVLVAPSFAAWIERWLDRKLSEQRTFRAELPARVQAATRDSHALIDLADEALLTTGDAVLAAELISSAYTRGCATSNDRMHRAVATMYAARRDCDVIDHGLAWLRAYGSHDDHAEVLRYIARAQARRGDHVAAAKSLEQAIAKASKFGEHLGITHQRWLAELAVSTERYDMISTLPHGQPRYWDLTPGDGWVCELLHGIARAALRGDMDSARALAAHHDEDPEWFAFAEHTVDAYFERRRELAARWLARDGRWTCAALDELITRIDAGPWLAKEREASQRMVDELLTRMPDSPRVLFGLAEHAIDDLRRPADALALLARIGPDDPRKLNMCACAHSALGDHLQAIALAERCLVAEPDEIVWRDNLASFHARAGDISRAEAMYLEVIALDETYSWAHVNLATVRVFQSREHEALACLERALAEGHDRLKIAGDRALEPLKTTPDFHRLMNR